MRRVCCLTAVLFLLVNTVLYAQVVEFEVDESEEDPIYSIMMQVAEKAYEKNKQGIEALESGNPDKAQKLFKEACELVPGYTDAENNIGVAWLKRGNTGRAGTIWKELVDKEPEYFLGWYNLGVCSMWKEGYKKANTYFRKSVEVNKEFVKGWVMYGESAMQSGDYREAEHGFEKAMKLDNSEKAAFRSLAYIYLVKGDTSDAVELMESKPDDHAMKRMRATVYGIHGENEKALKLLSEVYRSAKDPVALLKMAELHLEQDNCKKAVSKFNKYFSIESEPGIDPYILASIAHKNCGSQDKAESLLEEGVKRHQESDILKFNLAQIYFYQGKYNSAYKMFKRITDKLSDASFYHLKALTERELGKLKEAELSIKKALDYDSRPVYYDFLGVVYHQTGRKKQAKKMFKKANSLNPDLHSASIHLAVAEKDSMNMKKAVSQLSSKLSSCSKNCFEYALRLSLLYYHSGEYRKAVSVLEDVEESKNDVKALKHLATYYRAIPDLQKAIKMLKNALSIEPDNIKLKRELAEDYLSAGIYRKATDLLKELIGIWDGNPWRIYYQLGYSALQRKQLKEAERFFLKSIKYRDNSASVGLLAYVYNQMGKKDKASELWERNASEDPDNPVVLINLGLVKEEKDAYSEALTLYRKALAVSEEPRKSIYINIGNALKGMKKHEKARKAYEKAMDSDRRKEAVYNLLLIALINDDKEKAARMAEILKDEFEGSIYQKRAEAEISLIDSNYSRTIQLLGSLDKKEASDWFALGRAYLAEKQYKDARVAAEKLADNIEWRERKYKLIGRIAFEEGSYAEAKDYFSRLKDSDPVERLNYIKAAYGNSNYIEVIEEADNIIQELSGEDKDYLMKLQADAYRKLEEWDSAARVYTSLAEGEYGSNPEVLFNTAVCLFNKEMYKDAIKYYRKAKREDSTIHSEAIEKYMAELEKEPEKEISKEDKLFNQALNLQNSGDLQLAASAYKKVIEENNKHYRAWNNLGTIYGQLGELEKAVECYKNAVSWRADLEDGYANLVNIYIALEKYEEASAWLDKWKDRLDKSELMLRMERKIQTKSVQ